MICKVRTQPHLRLQLCWTREEADKRQILQARVMFFIIPKSLHKWPSCENFPLGNVLGQPCRSWRFSSLLMGHRWLELLPWETAVAPWECPGPPKTHELFPDPQPYIIHLKLPAWGQVPGRSYLNLSVDNPWNISVPLVYSTPGRSRLWPSLWPTGTETSTTKSCCEVHG